MKVNIKCFSSLSDKDTCDYRDSKSYELAAGETVEDLIVRTGIGRENVKIAFVNSKRVALDTILSDGDQVGLAPAVGGM
jgi:molybdopterin converting factor small subunit